MSCGPESMINGCPFENEPRLGVQVKIHKTDLLPNSVHDRHLFWAAFVLVLLADADLVRSSLFLRPNALGTPTDGGTLCPPAEIRTLR